MANPVESGPRCRKLSSIAVISLPTLVAPSRWMSPAIPHIVLPPLFPRATALHLERACSLPASGQAVEIHLKVPLGRGVQEALPLVALILIIEAIHLTRQRRADDLVLLERGESIAESHRQLTHLLTRFHGLIDVTLFGRPRIEIALESVVHRHEQRGRHQMRVHHGVDRAIFEASRRRDTKAGGTILEAPIG